MGVGGQSRAPAALPPGAENLAPTRTVQPVVSRYTDWAIPAHCIYRRLFQTDGNAKVVSLFN
jgi:hypothetical protein